MKKILNAALFMVFITIAAPSNAKEALNASPVATSSMSEAETQRLINRLEEINAMDKDDLTRAEKRELRKEVKSIKKSMDTSGGIYLSAGAVILIVVLLIILL